MNNITLPVMGQTAVRTGSPCPPEESNEPLTRIIRVNSYLDTEVKNTLKGAF